MKKHIVLIQPDIPDDFPLGRNETTVPLGLLVIAGSLRAAGYKVDIVDDSLERRGALWVAERVFEKGADFVGISVNLATVTTAGLIGNELNKISIPFVIGGPEVMVNLEYVLKQTGTKFAVQGEGEETFVELLSAYFGNQDYGCVKGLTFWDKNADAYVTNQRRPWINMDTIPLMPLDILPLGRYNRRYFQFETSPVQVLNTSRGCPYQCAFCSNRIIWSMEYRCISAKRLIEHVKHILSTTDTKGIYFREDHFTLNKERVISFCDLLKQEGLTFEWGCESRVDRLDSDLVTIMKEAGCRSMWFGVESGSDEVLKRIKKGVTTEQIRRAFKICREEGIRVGASVMFGIPGESKEELKQTLRFLKEINPDWIYYSAFFGLPGSEMYQTLLDNPKYVHSKWHSLILANSDDKTWPEKLKFKHRVEFIFNVRPRTLLNHIKRMGILAFTKKAFSSVRNRLKTMLNLK